MTEARRLMVQRDLMGRDIADNQVLAAMGRVPRHLFVPPRLEEQAYNDHPLPIGYGVTISQPYIVALMTQAAGIKPGQRVLEVGTGSGYQAAILATLTDKVYSIELIPELAQSAGERLARLGYRHVQVKSGDGYLGWPEFAPFDAIIVTAAAPEIPVGAQGPTQRRRPARHSRGAHLRPPISSCASPNREIPLKKRCSARWPSCPW